MKVIIKGKEIDLELTEKQKTAVERALRPQTGWERVKAKEYFYILENNVEPDDDVSTKYDNKNYDDANYFNDIELIENIIRAQTLQRKLWRRSAELCDKTDWLSNDNDCYCIYYDYTIHVFEIDVYSYARHFGQVYFDTEKHAEQALEEFRDELTWYFTEFKSRMD